MAKAPLRLRVDSPYPGESMSSFLSRTAQFYAMSTQDLFKELLQGHSWSSVDRRDVDLEPSSLLLQRLSEVVPDWRSPAADHEGFMHWTLAQRQRRAYCPTCFQEDLAHGRTPYFRNDWIPVLVTCCWKHGTPLFDWEMARHGGWRYLPKGWIYKKEADGETPAFMQHHLDLLGQLGTPGEPVIDLGEQIPASEAFVYLRRLQTLVEKPFAEPRPHPESFRTDLGAFQSIARELVRFAARHQHRDREPPVAAAICPAEGAAWIAPIPGGSRRRAWEYSDFGVRQTSCIRWRRCYQLFVARTLLGMERFRTIFPTVSVSQMSPWREWWQGWVYPRMGPEQQHSLDWYRQSILRND